MFLLRGGACSGWGRPTAVIVLKLQRLFFAFLFLLFCFCFFLFCFQFSGKRGVGEGLLRTPNFVFVYWNARNMCLFRYSCSLNCAWYLDTVLEVVEVVRLPYGFCFVCVNWMMCTGEMLGSKWVHSLAVFFFSSFTFTFVLGVHRCHHCGRGGCRPDRDEDTQAAGHGDHRDVSPTHTQG